MNYFNADDRRLSGSIELPTGYVVGRSGYLLGPDDQVVANQHLGDGLWWRGYGAMGTGVDTHPVRRRSNHPYGPFAEYACCVDNCESKGFGMRRGAFISSLDIDFRTDQAVRRLCWDLVEAGDMAPYDEAHIRRLAVEHLTAEMDKLRSMRDKLLEL